MPGSFYSQSPHRTVSGRILSGVLCLVLGLPPLILVSLGFSFDDLGYAAFYFFMGSGAFVTIIGLIVLFSLHRSEPIKFIQLDNDCFQWGEKAGSIKTIPTEEIQKMRWEITFDHNLYITIFHSGGKKTRFPYLFDTVLTPRDLFLGCSSKRFALTTSRKQFYDYLCNHHPDIEVDLLGDTYHIKPPQD